MTNTHTPGQTRPTERPAHAEHGCCQPKPAPAGVDVHKTVAPRDDAPAKSCCGGTSHQQH